MFSEYLKENYDWDTTTREINSMTASDVERALAKERLTDRDFMALISPAAAPYIETMARRSREITEKRFGKTISIFIPLYITNSCTNSCCSRHRLYRESPAGMPPLLLEPHHRGDAPLGRRL